jgi:putative PIN family toxin of toxin-antitoxin system
MRAVLDTNVVVSALIWGGTPFTLLQAATEGDLLLCTSPALLMELRDVLARPHLASRLERQRSSVEQALALYAGLAASVAPAAIPQIVPDDPDDDHVIAASVAANADLLVSGDRHLLALGTHQGIRIVTTAEAVQLIAAT